jgi:hypothetical protein
MAAAHVEFVPADVIGEHPDVAPGGTRFHLAGRKEELKWAN